MLMYHTIKMFLLYCCSIFSVQAMHISQLSRLEQDLALLARSIPKQPLSQQVQETVLEKLTSEQAQALYKAAEAKREPVDFFEQVMGITEAEFLRRSPADRLTFFTPTSSYETPQVLKNTKTKKEFSTGIFRTININTLRNQALHKHKGSGCKFNVIEGFDDPTKNWFRSKVDVAALQADPANKDAVFQVASNFNGLEAGGNPDAGLMIYLSRDYFVQGETAAISAAPGLIYRMYYIPFRDAEGTTYYGQSKERQINFLANFSSAANEKERIPVINGYPDDNDTVLEHFNKMNDNQLHIYSGVVNIGVQEGVQVTHGLSKLKNEQPEQGRITRWAPVTNPEQYINQVFSAAYMVKGAASQYENVARMILQASYEGVLKYAFFYDKKKVFLTLIGGGVFNNPIEWIAEALIKAVREFTDKGDMEITLVIYSSGLYSTNSYWNTFVRELLTLTQQTKGTYTRYKKDGTYKVELA